jgi:hypothetical protein
MYLKVKAQALVGFSKLIAAGVFVEGKFLSTTIAPSFRMNNIIPLCITKSLGLVKEFTDQNIMSLQLIIEL